MNLNQNIVWFDCETTGLEKELDRIIEICMIKTDPQLNEIDRFYSRFNPQGRIIAEAAKEKTGITDAELLKEPLFEEKAEEIYNFIQDCILAGHNVLSFDIPMLNNELRRVAIAYSIDLLNTDVIDTRMIYNKCATHRLIDIYSELCHKDLIDAHKASSDIEATMEVYKKECEKWVLDDQIYDEINDVINIDYDGKFAYSKSKKCYYITFGKHKDVPLQQVPLDYLKWMATNEGFSMDTRKTAAKFINKLTQK